MKSWQPLAALAISCPHVFHQEIEESDADSDIEGEYDSASSLEEYFFLFFLWTLNFWVYSNIFLFSSLQNGLRLSEFTQNFRGA